MHGDAVDPCVLGQIADECNLLCRIGKFKAEGGLLLAGGQGFLSIRDEWIAKCADGLDRQIVGGCIGDGHFVGAPHQIEPQIIVHSVTRLGCAAILNVRIPLTGTKRSGGFFCFHGFERRILALFCLVRRDEHMSGVLSGERPGIFIFICVKKHQRNQRKPERSDAQHLFFHIIHPSRWAYTSMIYV